MLSSETCQKINCLTEAALHSLDGMDVIDRVTVIRGYEQLAAMFPEEDYYDEDLRRALVQFRSVIERRPHSNDQIARELESLIDSMETAREETGHALVKM